MLVVAGYFLFEKQAVIGLLKVFVTQKIIELDTYLIYHFRESCDPYYGDVISWSDIYRGLKGDIRFEFAYQL